MTTKFNDAISTNNQLREENRCFANLLEERTMNGRLNFLSIYDELETNIQTSLADEVSSNSFSERIKYLEEDNKALTLYINRILSKVLECGVMDSVLES